MFEICKLRSTISGASLHPMLSRSIERIRASAYGIPTDRPESDGTLEWDVTTTTTTTTVELGADVSLAVGERMLLPGNRSGSAPTGGRSTSPRSSVWR